MQTWTINNDDGKVETCARSFLHTIQADIITTASRRIFSA